MRKLLCKLLVMSMLVISMLSASGCSKGSSNFILLDIPQAMELVDCTRADVYEQLGNEMKNFEPSSTEGIGDCYMYAKDVYSTAGGIEVDILGMDFQWEGDESPLVAVRYILPYANMEEKQQIIDWIVEQKDALEDKWGKEADYQDVPGDLTAEGAKNQNEFSYGWSFTDMPGDKENYVYTYMYKIGISEENITVTLCSNESYSNWR